MREKTGPIGERRWPRIDGPDAGVVKALMQRGTTELCDAMRLAGFFDPGIRPLFSGFQPFAGPAVTVAIPAGSQEARRAAIALAQPGDVLVVTARGLSSFAVMGGNLAAYVHRQGLVGVVIDGYVRDAAEIESLGLPVFCRGSAVAASPPTGPGEVNVPIACGGLVVDPGDVIVGDSSGIIAVPREWAEELVTVSPR